MSPRRKPGAGRLVIGTVVLATALLGCGGPAGRDEPDLGALPVVPADGAVALPLDAYVSGPAEQAVLRRAMNVVLQDCMHRLGLSRWSPQPESPQAPAPRRFLIGILDASQAATFGYHPVRAGSPTPVGARSGAADPVELAALSGKDAATVLPGRQVPPGGCVGEANRRISGRPDDTTFVDTLMARADRAAADDSRVRRATAAWRTCMRAAGYTYDTPIELAEQDWPAPEPPPVELALAGADVRCKRDTPLASTWIAAVAAHQRLLVDQHRERLDRIRAALADQQRQAEEIVQEASR